MIENYFQLFLRKYKLNNKGGFIYVDRRVYKWLNSFTEKKVSNKSYNENEIYKLLLKHDFDENPNAIPPQNIPKISIILVLFNSEHWVENLKQMFNELDPWLNEIIIVDNGSKDDCLAKLNKHIPRVKSIKNNNPKSYAAAINQGTKIANGDIFLIINPDVYIPKSSLWALIDSYEKNQNVAAISPKLLLMKTPGFINGVGNIVTPFWHGYDQGLGHLDVGQFDDIFDLPSACFATILIPRKSWEEIGELDEEFPLYYEDTDWCYRARKNNKRIIFSPHAKIYHAYKSSSLNSNHLRNQEITKITIGRIRFARKNIDKNKQILYLVSYFLNDIINYFKYLLMLKKSFFNCLFLPWIKEIIFSNITTKSNKENWHFSDYHQIKTRFYPSIYKGLPILTSRSLNRLINLRNNHSNQ